MATMKRTNNVNNHYATLYLSLVLNASPQYQAILCPT